ncbi:hypothetical protein [Streptomyces sp. SID2888]|uniref:hypothetical protein n=1 Tax=Streptomyces sp. SID2888 TaxID=2690256 RepID=UPI001370002C|nr:hypothetical protein [Streptomyces sp. SID2888]
MTAPTPHDPAAVALELERLRRSVEVGFEKQAGSLALLVQRAGQTDRAVDDLDSRVTSLERARWPLPSIAALTGVGALALSVWQASAR